MLERDERALFIAKEMVKIPSINSTGGEKNIGDFLEHLFMTMPYFVKHPDQLSIKELKNDSLHRKNVMALIIGEKEYRSETLVLHGHTDTVGVEDFGSLKEYAFSPDILVEKLKELDLPEDIRKDLESGEYMFGRGSCDMKSGDAVFISLIEWLVHNISKLSGNILLSLNPVEENLHTGVIEGLDTLLEWKEKYKLKYQMAINNDYTCPLYDNDKKITMYTGVVGKLLPCFYIQGKETHVGQCFEGLDASYTAARLVEKIHLNMDFSDIVLGEASMPPSVLKMKDLKPWYNVQTAKDALVYFNYFVHNAEIDNITDKLVDAARKALEDTRIKVENMAAEYYENSYLYLKNADKNISSTPRTNDSKGVLLYEELVDMVREKTKLSMEKIKSIEAGINSKERAKKTDLREIPIAVIKYFLGLLGINDSVIVLYFAPPYCPHNMLQKDCSFLENDLKEITLKVAKDANVEYRFMHFFPSLSDSSYLKIDDSDKSLTKLKNNFPMMEQLYPLPIEKIKKLNIPSVDFGCYGKDAHKWTERVNIPYTFEVLPHLLKETLKHFKYI